MFKSKFDIVNRGMTGGGGGVRTARKFPGGLKMPGPPLEISFRLVKVKTNKYQKMREILQTINL